MTNGNSPVYPPREGELLKGDGMSKRELFAAMAMQGVITGWSDPNAPWQEYHPELVADRAVKVADALIHALNKTK